MPEQVLLVRKPWVRAVQEVLAPVLFSPHSEHARTVSVQIGPRSLTPHFFHSTRPGTWLMLHKE